MTADRERSTSWSSRLRDEAKKRWDRLTDEDLRRIDEPEGLAESVRERYGRSREEAERDVRGFLEDASRIDAGSRKERDRKESRGDGPESRSNRPAPGGSEEMW
jgi:hypothetical protein